MNAAPLTALHNESGADRSPSVHHRIQLDLLHLGRHRNIAEQSRLNDSILKVEWVPQPVVDGGKVFPLVRADIVVDDEPRPVLFRLPGVHCEAPFVEILRIILKDRPHGLSVQIVHDIGVGHMPRFEVIHDDKLDRPRPVLIHRIPGEGLRQINDAVPTGNVQSLHLLRRRIEQRAGSGDKPPIVPCVLIAKCDRMVQLKSPFLFV